MPMPHTAKYPKPSCSKEFEQLCCDVLRTQHGWINATLHGRLGQGQQGVDIFAQNVDGICRGAQCKIADEIQLRSIRIEIEKARSFQPLLRSYFIMTSASRDADVQENLRMHLADSPAPFPVECWFWEDICQRFTPEIVRQYFPWWIEETPSFDRDSIDDFKDDYLGHVDDSLNEPNIEIICTAGQAFASMKELKDLSDNEQMTLRERYRDQILKIYGSLPMSEYLAKDELTAALDTGLRRYLTERQIAWNKSMRTIQSEPPQDPMLKLVFMTHTEDGELDVGFRNHSDTDAVISLVAITVLRDHNYIAPMLNPSANYTMPIGQMETGDTISLDICQVVPAKSADRFLIDLDDIRCLDIHVCFRTNGGYCISRNRRLFA